MKLKAPSLDSTKLKKESGSCLERLKICVFNVWYIHLSSEQKNSILSKTESYHDYFDEFIWPDRLQRLDRIIKKQETDR